MAQLRVGIGDGRQLVFHFATIRTQSYETTPVMDPSGLHYECTRVTLDIIGIVNAVTIATNKKDPSQVGTSAVERTDDPDNGDPLPTSMLNMRDMLMHPRRPVTFEMGEDGGTVQVIDLPRFGGGGPQGRHVSDARGGPFPERAVWTQIAGDKTAILSYRVTCYDSYNEQVLTSHNWQMTSTVDRNGYTTRSVSGRAAFRLDGLEDKNLQADDFRRLLMHEVPPGMRRVAVEVTQAANGWEYYYSFVDREVTMGLPEGGPVVEVTGSVTGGIIYPIRDAKQMINSIIGMRDTVNNAVGNLDFMGLIFNPLKQAFANYTPTQVNSGVARAVGRKGCSRRLLSQTALSFLLDRFAPLLGNNRGGGFFIGNGKIQMITVTHNFDTDNAPVAEVNIEVMGLTANAIQAIMRNEPETLMKLDDTVLLGNRPMASIGGADPMSHKRGPSLASSGGTRGTSLVRLLRQALEQPTDSATPQQANLPASPQRSEKAKDADRKI